MSKLYIFEIKPGQKIWNAARQAVALARRKKAPILFQFDKFTHLLLTPHMEPKDILSMYRNMGHTKIAYNKQQNR